MIILMSKMIILMGRMIRMIILMFSMITREGGPDHSCPLRVWSGAGVGVGMLRFSGTT